MEFLCKNSIPEFEIPVKSFAIPFFNLLPYCEPSRVFSPFINKSSANISLEFRQNWAVPLRETAQG
jgi:hypothetical protein